MLRLTLCLSVFSPFPLAPPPDSAHPVSVTEVECVREGCQSEVLRKLAGSVPESHCFTVIFRGGARKSLDLCCQTAEEARCWVRGIRTLKDRVANMSQKEKLDQYP
ncbi:hypothetical protein Z043_109378 [Scleropages formosus]|uniref:phosphoinositide phospholipase C n=1 Tax=Scleropages formosus TaxID=113540 RepID=A0A0P7UR34_SCLFO|nr:hypothetical protein Z043_109378 [Scleropages formosus]